MKLKSLFFGFLFSIFSYAALAQSVEFIEPKDGATVSSPFKVIFAVTGMEVLPAGQMKTNTGHHHLIINAANVPEGAVVPFNDSHIHYGKGQTESEVTLTPGKYKLTMQFANGAHQSYGPKLSKTIEVVVK